MHPLARRAAMETMDALQSAAVHEWRLNDPGNGKMFGVLLVAAADDIIGYLRAFSGMVDGGWEIAGWSPPTFDAVKRDRVWIPGEAEMRHFAAQRERIANDVSAVRALDDVRASRSRELMRVIQDTYHFADAYGNVRALRELFAPAEPPGGAGDCAAPKLLAHAYALGLRPLALAEFWWGASPVTGDRRAGSFYPACRGKCPPILTHMLRGVPVESPPVYGAQTGASHEPTVLYEDEQLLAVYKPSGLLSVPGRSGLLRDSVATRLRARYPDAPGALVVHRLDLDTSGIVLAAKNADTFSALQRLFALRAITKQYVAWVDGDVGGDTGRIELPLRVDIDDRPRQIHDAAHGKPAETSWEVLERSSGRTRVRLVPHTGRTHQLRVHAAHPCGLDAPILGDRLYGRAAPEYGERLLLHAESLGFTHPGSGQPVHIHCPAPF